MRSQGMTFGRTTDEYFHLFSPQNRFFVTPFQRPYTWDTKHIDGIIDDFLYIEKTGESVGWPSILLQKQTTIDSANSIVYDLGDGQQRVISISLAILAIWHNYMRIKSTFEDPNLEGKSELLENIIPQKNHFNISYGEIASTQKQEHSGIYEVKPYISFASDKTNKTYKRLFHRSVFQDLISTIQELEDRESLRKYQHDGSANLLKNFYRFYMFFFENKNSVAALEASLTNIYENIRLTTHIYEANENMQRAFAKMNSFGIKLTNSELVKSDLYGRAKLENATLAEELANYWNEKLETGRWIEKYIGQGKAANKSNFLEYFLDQTHMSRNFERLQKTQHLSVYDLWHDFLNENPTEISVLWKSIKRDIEVFESASSLDRPTPGTVEWWNYYFYHVMDSVKMGYGTAILLKLNRDLSGEDLIKAIQMLMKHFFYSYTVGLRTSPGSYLIGLFKRNERFLSQALSYEGLKDYLENVSGVHQWRDQEYIVKNIANETFKNDYNPFLVELFIFVRNMERFSVGDNDSLFSAASLQDKKTREHILPQNPEKEMSPEEKSSYTFIVGKIGNTLPLPGSSNSKIGNKEVEKKIPTYLESKDHTSWGYWVRKWLQFYEDNGRIWNKDTIEKYSFTLAKEISAYLIPEVPNLRNYRSSFLDLLEDFEPGEIFYSINSETNECLDFYLTESGELQHKNETIIYARRLTELVAKTKSKKNYHDILIVKENDLTVSEYRLSGQDNDCLITDLFVTD